MKNLTNFKKILSKKGIPTSFITPDSWISTGNYALNFRMVGHFEKGIPNKRSVMFWGPKGSGKTYLLALAAKEAQKAGYHVIYIDTESAAEESYMNKVGLDLSTDALTPISVGSVEEATEVISNLCQSATPTDKIFLCLDSLSMLLSEKEIKDFDSGIMKGDQGQMAKKLKLFMKNVNNKIAAYDMFFVCTGHAYRNQDIKNGKGEYIFSGGEGVEYIPSVAVFVNRAKLKDGDEQVPGIRMKVEVTKTRFTTPYGKVVLQIPYSTGLTQTEGLLGLAEEAGLVNRNAGWYTYKHAGKEMKFQKSKFDDHVMNLFDFDTDQNPEEVTDGKK